MCSLMAFRLSYSQLSTVAFRGLPISRGLLPLNGKSTGKQRKGFATAGSCSSRPDFGTGGSGIVDANIMVLRKRIHQLKLHERQQNDHGSEAPQDWLNWEKDCYFFYQEELCLVLARVQSRLLKTRPLLLLSLMVCISIAMLIAGLYTLTAIMSWLQSVVPQALPASWHVYFYGV